MDRHFVGNLITRLATENLSMVQERALKNYQVPGFTSIVLMRSPILTLRLYVCMPGESQLHNSLRREDNTLWIHDHRFSFQTQVLAGYMRNLLFVEGTGEDRGPKAVWGNWYKYRYHSALMNPDGHMRLELLGIAPLLLDRVQTIETGYSYSMSANELHRILIPNDRFVAMLFWEHARIKDTSILYSREELPECPSTEGLYIKPSEEELANIIDTVLKKVSYR